MLQELLNLGLVEIGGDDSRFEKMGTAATALAERFRAEPHLLIPAILVALDEDVDEDDPFFVLVEEMVTAEWKTLRNTHSNRPRQLLRSITLHALKATSTESAEISSVIWNTASILVRHQQTRLGKAAHLIEKMLNEAYERAEDEAINRAGMSSRPMRIADQSEKITPKLDIDAEIAVEDIDKDVACAVGPTNKQNQAIQNSNPHWPNTGQPWSNEFTPRIAEVMTKAVNLGTSRLSEAIVENLPSLMQGYLEMIEQQRGELKQSAAAERMRLDVLWWSEARYSPLLRKGYREVPPPVVAFAAAVDLAAIIQPLVPASVSYLLAETVADICKGPASNQSSQPLEDYLKLLVGAPQVLCDELPRVASNKGRSTLVTLIVEAVAGTIVPDTVRDRFGITPELQLTPADLAMWIFRDIQARRMVESLAEKCS